MDPLTATIGITLIGTGMGAKALAPGEQSQTITPVESRQQKLAEQLLAMKALGGIRAGGYGEDYYRNIGQTIGANNREENVFNLINKNLPKFAKVPQGVADQLVTSAVRDRMITLLTKNLYGIGQQGITNLATGLSTLAKMLSPIGQSQKTVIEPTGQDRAIAALSALTDAIKGATMAKNIQSMNAQAQAQSQTQQGQQQKQS